MKKLFTLFVGASIASISLFSCGGNEQAETNTEDQKKKELALKEEQLKKEKAQQDSINKALSAIQVRIFNHEPLVYDSEGWCIMPNNSAKIKEVKDFNSTKNYVCKEGNYIQKLSIEGVFNGINIQFLDGKDKIVKEFKEFDLNESVSYSGLNYQPKDQQEIKLKDQFYQDWFEKAEKIQISYGDSIFYSASWKSNGYFYQ